MGNTHEEKQPPINVIDDLTVSDDYNVGLTGDQIFSENHISRFKPSQTEWFRVQGNSLNDIEKGVVCKIRVGQKDEDFIIGPPNDFRKRVEHDIKKVRKVLLGYYETSQGRLGIWPVSEPMGRNMSNKWIDSAIQILELAQKSWVKFTSNQSNGAYDCFRAREIDQEQYGEPKFIVPYKKVIALAWGNDFTLRPETYDKNEYVRQAIGQQIGLKVSEHE